MATASGEEIFARARTIATQAAGSDANMSPQIDSKAGIRALLNSSIREIYRRYANDQKFIRDTVTIHTIAITAGAGTCPDEIMREFLHQANITDANDSLVTYYNYGADYNSGANFSQLGYLVLESDAFQYTAPAPDLATYTGNIFISVPTFPTFPADMADPITFPSETAIDDIVLFLANAILGREMYQIVGVTQ